LRELIAQLPQDAQPQLWDRTKLMELSVEGKRYVKKTRFRPVHGSLGKSREGTAALGGRPAQKNSIPKS
jgi:hypothetical protein